MIVQQTVDFIKNYGERLNTGFSSRVMIGCLGLNEPGILCRSAPVKLIKFVQKKYNAGLWTDEVNEEDFSVSSR